MAFELPKIDLNPLNSSLFTGAGLPWGAMKNPEAGDMPAVPQGRNVEDFYNNELVKRLIEQIRAGSSKQQMGAMRQASAKGVAQSDAARLAQDEISSLAEERAAMARMGEVEKAYGRKQAADTADMERYKLAAQNWATKKANYENEEARRNSQYGQFASTLGTLAALL